MMLNVTVVRTSATQLLRRRAGKGDDESVVVREWVTAILDGT